MRARRVLLLGVAIVTGLALGLGSGGATALAQSRQETLIIAWQEFTLFFDVQPRRGDYSGDSVDL